VTAPCARHAEPIRRRAAPAGGIRFATSRLLVRAAVCVIGGMLLCSTRAAAEPQARAPETRFFFDARQPFAQPMVRIDAFGRPQMMVLDTGSSVHVIGFKGAGLTPVPTTVDDIIATDYAGRAIAAIRAPIADVRLPGWPPLSELWVSTWADPRYRGRAIRPGEPHADGVLSPLHLAREAGVVVLDFTTGTLTAGSWADAGRRLAAGDLSLTPGPVSVTGGGKLLVPMVTGDRTLLMALDTGAPTSWLFVPRGRDLPEELTRISERELPVRVGELALPVRFSMLERVSGATLGQDDGLLGMDVLRSCILALDPERFQVRCRSTGPSMRAAASAPRGSAIAMPSDLMSMRTSGRLREKTVQVSDLIEMRQRADGGYDWNGNHVAARIRKDGSVSFSKALRDDDSVVHAEIDGPEERRWFEEHVGGLLVALAHAHEREVILDALAALPRHLAAILDDKRLSLAQRRHILFLLWDEMAEPDDAERGWAGARARRLIDAFIQRRLPPGAPGAFSDAELAAFNQTRKNGIRFEPYAPTAIDRRDPGDAP
jgi:hypothetical protein